MGVTVRIGAGLAVFVASGWAEAWDTARSNTVIATNVFVIVFIGTLRILVIRGKFRRSVPFVLLQLSGMIVTARRKGTKKSDRLLHCERSTKAEEPVQAVQWVQADVESPHIRYSFHIHQRPYHRSSGEDTPETAGAGRRAAKLTAMPGAANPLVPMARTSEGARPENERIPRNGDVRGQGRGGRNTTYSGRATPDPLPLAYPNNKSVADTVCLLSLFMNRLNRSGHFDPQRGRILRVQAGDASRTGADLEQGRDRRIAQNGLVVAAADALESHAAEAGGRFVRSDPGQFGRPEIGGKTSDGRTAQKLAVLFSTPVAVTERKPYTWLGPNWAHVA